MTIHSPGQKAGRIVATLVFGVLLGFWAAQLGMHLSRPGEVSFADEHELKMLGINPPGAVFPTLLDASTPLPQGWTDLPDRETLYWNGVVLNTRGEGSRIRWLVKSR